MKKQLVITLLSAMLVWGCNTDKNHHESQGFLLKGTLKGISEGTITLATYNPDDRTSKVIDSGIIKNGAFELSGKIGDVQLVNLNIKPGNWSFNLFLEDTVLAVDVDTSGSQYYDYTQYGGTKGAIIKKIQEAGSANFDDWMTYLNNPLQKKYDPVFASLGALIETTKDIDEQYRYRDQMDSVRRLLTAWQENQVSTYIDQHPERVAGAYLLRNLYDYNSDMSLDSMEAMMSKFKGGAQSSVYYKSLQGIIAKRKAVLPGSLAPDFTLLKRDSTLFTLSSARGRYMMIDFWASWCHPCRKAIPHWKEIYARYHDKGFDIVSVSDDSRWTDWTRAMDQEKMPWQQVIDEFPVKNMPAKVGSLYMTTYIPFYVLVDKEGKIVLYTDKEDKMDAQLKEIFGS